MTTPRRRFTPNPVFNTFSPTALKGKVVVVNPAGSTLGEQLAFEMARMGAHLVLSDEQPQRVAHVEQELFIQGRRSLAVECDGRDYDQIVRAVQHTVDIFGRIDVLINCAVEAALPRPAAALPHEVWHTELERTLHGAWYFSQAAGQQMIQQNGGAIINLISVDAWQGAAGLVHAASARAGVWNLTKTLGAEWGAHNVRVNAIGTPRPDAPNSPTWQQVAWLAIFLASDAASYITCECLDLSGG